MTLPPQTVARLATALPFAMSFLLIPLAYVGAVHGGWLILLLPVATWYLFSLLDLAVGLNTDNADPDTSEADMFW